MEISNLLDKELQIMIIKDAHWSQENNACEKMSMSTDRKYKDVPNKTMELKKIITDLKNSIKEFNNWLDQVDKRISEGKQGSGIYPEEQKEKKKVRR